MAMKTGDFCEFDMRMKVTKISKRKKENKNGILRSLKRFFIDDMAIFLGSWERSEINNGDFCSEICRENRGERSIYQSKN